MEIEYAAGAASVREVQQALEDIGSRLAGHPDGDRLEALGIPPSELTNLVSIRSGAAGIDQGVVAIIVALAPALNHVARSAWDEVLLPWLTRVLGKGAIGEEQERRDSD